MKKMLGAPPVPSVEPVGDAEQNVAAGVSVVGIGASAGGLEAFRLVLATLPADTGLAVVLIQHLDPTHDSSLTEILGRATTMPVVEAVDGAPVEGNHVYVIPPNTELTIANRLLKVRPRRQAPGAHLPIDRFLRSLAGDCRGKAIGVILSGSGSDGSLGLEAIREAGGVTFAQEPATAEFPSMPRSAEAGGCVDFVLPPAEIAAELARIARDPHLALAQPTARERSPAEGSARLKDVLAAMYETTGIDFALYQEKTVQRRIMRRLALRNVKNIEEYLTLLKRDPGEAGLLQKDLLISVTRFFRNSESFDALSKVVFPAIVRNRPGDSPIRIWVAGCATGEEAYSLAICLREFLSQTGVAFPIQIFGSDVSEASIQIARGGKYRESIAADVSAERLAGHFTKVEGGYQVSKAVRDLCVFSRHNLIDDPPFAKLDLISCRNVLIYLGAVQKYVISLFHYALKPDGFLTLGPSETGDSDGLFSIVDRDRRIYRKKEVEGRPQRFHARSGVSRRNTEAARLVAPAPVVEHGDADLRTAVNRIILSKYHSAAVLVDDGLVVLEVRGDVTPFFRLPTGKMSFHLLNLVPDTGLFLEIEKLVRQAAESGEVARQARVPCDCDGGIREVNLEVTPLYGKQRGALLILLEGIPQLESASQKIEDRAAASTKQPVKRGQAIRSKDRQIAKLKHETTEARRRLVSALEEHQISDEESQSATEEAQSANEELQSLDEELETAKEELQSTNEELITVNQELELKNTALTDARNFANSVVETLQMPLLTLDREMRVTTVNQAFSSAFLIPRSEAVGRLFYSLGGGSSDLPGLRNLLNRVLSADQSFDNFEVKWSFPPGGTRELVISAHRVEHLDLVLVAIDDVTLRRMGERDLHTSEEALRQSQKTEAIGRLAGGIAHDFSNLLTVIIGYSRLAADTLDGGHEAIECMQEIEKAAQRAAGLTDQLLAFSRQKVLQPKVFDLNTVVLDFEKMLRHILGGQIKFAFRPGLDLWRVKADPGEIGRALMNLCLNARDAMPAGGTLTIETANITCSEAEPHPHNLAAGQYVELDVRDTGIGMGSETQSHVFEPFFTTKKSGKGTGLGLATALAIVEQSGGTIWFDSKLGQGTNFKLLLPAIAAPAEPEELLPAALALEPKGHGEVILLVEDEDQVRQLACRILKSCGYVILEARDGREGLSVCEAHPEKIDLLLSDVVMPGLPGRELAERILTMRPDIKVLFMSGHTEDVILKEGIKAGTPFLRKPFLPAELAHHVRKVLQSQAHSLRSAG